MVMVLVLGPGAAYEARVGLVGSTLMGRSQLKVSTGTCSGPVQVTGSGCSMGGRSTKPGSRDVTNSKCKRHFRDTVGKKIKVEALEARSKPNDRMWLANEKKKTNLYSGRAGRCGSGS